MKRYEPQIGEDISTTARRMVDMANEIGGTVTAKFNEVTLKANPSENPGIAAVVIVEHYDSESARRAEAYRNSPEGKAAAAEAEDRRQKEQRQMDEAMVELDSLDFSDLNAVINLLEKMRSPSDYIGVVTPSKQIIKTFRSHGYKPGVNCGKDFNGEDEDNSARWLIGQALSNLDSVGAIHQVYHRFAEE